MTGHRLTEVLPGVVSAGVLASFCDVAETGAPLESEVRYEQDGRTGWFRNMVVKVDEKQVARQVAIEAKRSARPPGADSRDRDSRDSRDARDAR